MLSHHKILMSVVFATIFLIACGGDTKETVSPTSAPPAEAPTPTATSGNLYPLNTRTGIQQLDSLLSLISSGRTMEIAETAVFVNVPCASRTRGQPPCGNESEGSILSVFRYASCEPNFVESREELAKRLSDHLTSIRPQLYAVLGIEQSEENQESAYAIILGVGQGQPALTVYANLAGGLTAVIACPSVQNLFDAGGTTIILRPKGP